MADAVFIQRRRQDGLVAGGRLPGQAAPGGDPGGQGNDAPRQGQPGEQSLRRQGLGRLLKGDHQGGGALPVLRSVRPGRGLLHSLGLRPAVRRGHHPHRQALPAPGGRKEKAALVNTRPRLQVRPCVYPAKKCRRRGKPCAGGIPAGFIFPAAPYPLRRSAAAAAGSANRRGAPGPWCNKYGFPPPGR